MKHFYLMQEKGKEIPSHFLDGAKRLADRLANIWERYGQFGQFADRETGEIVVGGSTAGALIPGALAVASQFWGEERYLKVAGHSGEMFYQDHAIKGYTTGGPGEILQCPDSESAFSLLESYVALYEVEKREKWLEYAVYMTNFCSSWVVSYNYIFPKGSEFSRLDMKTVGTVFANVQNKHSAPGICTLSGDSLCKVYQWTKNPLYLEFAKDVALTIGQYMSTEQRPIYSWNLTNNSSLLKENSMVMGRTKIPAGYICERVNMSDWETEHAIGGVFNGSCWPETSLLLALAETIPLFGSFHPLRN